MECTQTFVVAFSCKQWVVCPSCNGRKMVQTAAHLVDHVIPPVPVRHWVISLPKWLRGFLGGRPKAVAAVKQDMIGKLPSMRRAGRTDGSNLTVFVNALPPVSKPLYAVACGCWWVAGVVESPAVLPAHRVYAELTQRDCCLGFDVESLAMGCR